MNKSGLRKIYLERQKFLSPFERIRKSKRIADRFFREFSFNNVEFLHCFVAIKKFNEIDTSLIFKRLWRDFPQVQTTVPKVNFKSNKIENVSYTNETELAKNIWQICEPTTKEIIETEKIDIILVPLLSFDEKGFRVGYGKGFYDKLLKNCRNDCLKIGLSYFAPVMEIGDVKNFDVKLDFCVTPEEIWKFQT